MKKLKSLIGWIVCALFVVGIVWAAQVDILSTDTRQEGWGKEKLNNSDLQTNIDGKQATLTNSAGLAGALDDESGTGLAVFNDSPTLVTPALGTPSAAVLTNATGLPGTSITDDSILEASLDSTNAPTDNFVLSYDLASLGFTWVAAGAGSGDLKADGTVPLTADWDAGAYDIEASSFTSKKTSGEPGYLELVEGNSTDTFYIGRVGPDNIAESFSYLEPNAQPADGQIKVYSTPAGTGDPKGNKESTITFKDYVDAIEFVIDGGGSAITTGVKGFLEIPYACTINSVTALADQSGSIVVDLWVDTYANYPPTDADTITSSTPPTITTAIKSQDTTLTSWTVALSKGDIIGFNVDSITTCERVTISLKVDK